MISKSTFAAVVLAGERPGGSAFSRELGLSASVLVDVAGKSSLRRVIETLESSGSVSDGVLCGPDHTVCETEPEISDILAESSFQWLAPETGPSASALAGMEKLNQFPVLLTAGDHALLTPAIVDDFCTRAAELDADVVFGLAPYPRVREAFPESKRTVLRFTDGSYCGTNLFAILTPQGKAGPAFWRSLEADRKRPWKMARKIGPGLILKFFFRRLTLDSVLESLSRAMGCKVGCVVIENPRVAVDVDSVADRDLAVRILTGKI
ncbi:MAG: nucleotidyltransferase family protein [Xanthomonadales bacterium]|nr:nucleotidyltransferase family protein [Xanthomonadales bacterium]MDH4002435.1 nucleotidyltransferase family protein [Xanthomonadales bacterium]